jgi:uncharacterized membrane protein YbhN (UPF0104 family)
MSCIAEPVVDPCRRRLSAPRLSGRARTALTVAAVIGVTGALAVVLSGQGSAFTAALSAAPPGLLVLVAALQLGALVVRTEAWHVCVRATGARVARRRLYRAASVGYVAMLANGQLGVAARIAVLRRTCPRDAPRIPALLAAELPILATEGALAAIWSFTLALWVPLVAFVAMAGVGAGLCVLARRRRGGFWTGLAVLRSLDGRGRVVGLVLVAVLAQIARNWLVLRATGTPVSLFDSIAVLIAMVTLGQLPFGPGVGAAATVLILGTHGVATVAAAGVLLTATGTAGALAFAAWALADRVATDPRVKRVLNRALRRGSLPPPVPRPRPEPAA